MKTKPNAPASPCNNHVSIYNRDGFTGLTKREYFAGLAMQGFIGEYPESFVENNNKDLPEMANSCVYASDALIAALNKKLKND